MVHKIKQQREKAQQLLYKDNVVQRVTIPDSSSVVSGLTNASLQSDDDSLASASSLQTIDTKRVKKERKPSSFNINILSKMITPGMTREEARITAEAYFSHQQNREITSKDRILHLFLDEHFPVKEEQNELVSQQQDSTVSEAGSEFTQEVNLLENQISTPIPKEEKKSNVVEQATVNKVQVPVSSQNTEERQ